MNLSLNSHILERNLQLGIWASVLGRAWKWKDLPMPNTKTHHHHVNIAPLGCPTPKKVKLCQKPKKLDP